MSLVLKGYIVHVPSILWLFITDKKYRVHGVLTNGIFMGIDPSHEICKLHIARAH